MAAVNNGFIPRPPALTQANMQDRTTFKAVLFQDAGCPDVIELGRVVAALAPGMEGLFLDTLPLFLPVAPLTAAMSEIISNSLMEVYFRFQASGETALPLVQIAQFITKMPCQKAGEAFLHMYKHFFRDKSVFLERDYALATQSVDRPTAFDATPIITPTDDREARRAQDSIPFAHNSSSTGGKKTSRTRASVPAERKGTDGNAVPTVRKRKSQPASAAAKTGRTTKRGAAKHPSVEKAVSPRRPNTAPLDRNNIDPFRLGLDSPIAGAVAVSLGTANGDQMLQAGMHQSLRSAEDTPVVAPSNALIPSDNVIQFIDSDEALLAPIVAFNRSYGMGA